MNAILIDRGLLEQALDALQIKLEGYDGPVPYIDGAIDSLQDALAQPQQEPVANRKEFEQWCKHSGHDYCFTLSESGEYQWADAQGAYEAYWARNTLSQPARKPLTDEQWLSVGKQARDMYFGGITNIAAHGIKETK